MQNRGVPVVDVDAVFDGVPAEFIGGTVSHASANAATDSVPKRIGWPCILDDSSPCRALPIGWPWPLQAMASSVCR